ncbi:MAG TPA: ABC transporter substrate-binding protein [Polyangiaceae bacterium]|nr:ABC transporter substrate-binding protein [Polyangiaceae bacterium]
MRSLALALVLAAAAGAAAPGCSSPELDGTTWGCASDGDCGEGFACALAGDAGRCVRSDGAGAIRLGMSAPFQGPYAELGIEVRRGMEAYFTKVNRQGGVRGRPIELISRDDGYEPAAARANMKELLDVQAEVGDPDRPDVLGPNGVLAVVGNVGTPTMLETVPLAMKNRVVFFAPFTGANEYLRDDTKSPYVFNYRASYYEETAAMVDYLFKVRAPRVVGHDHVIAFAQDDSFGDAGYVGFSNAYNVAVAPLPSEDAILRVNYRRADPVNSTRNESVPEVTRRLAALVPPPPAGGAPPAPAVPVAILMVDTYAAGNALIRDVKDWLNASADRAAGLDVVFLHVSFVGSDSLAEQLTTTPDTYVDALTGERRSYAGGVIVTQVVPDYLSQASGVVEYRADVAANDQGAYSFNSLEGYLAAKLFVEALRRHEGPLTSPALVQTLEGKMTDVDVGIGQPLGFSLADHQASHKVWGSRLRDDPASGGAKFEIIWTWTPAGRIALE